MAHYLSQGTHIQEWWGKIQNNRNCIYIGDQMMISLRTCHSYIVKTLDKRHTKILYTQETLVIYTGWLSNRTPDIMELQNFHLYGFCWLNLLTTATRMLLQLDSDQLRIMTGCFFLYANDCSRNWFINILRVTMSY